MSVDLLRLQREQYAHDKRNHSDILTLSKNDRLKHYGLHFAKYVGRLARGNDEPKSIERTIVDTCLVCLSAANTLHQKLSDTHVCVRERKGRNNGLEGVQTAGFGNSRHCGHAAATGFQGYRSEAVGLRAAD